MSLMESKIGKRVTCIIILSFASSVISPREAIMSALLSIGLHYNWLLFHIYSSKVQSTSKSILNGETDSLSSTSSKCVDGVTKSALLKQLAITDGENKFQEFLAITIRELKRFLSQLNKKKLEEKFTCFQ